MRSAAAFSALDIERSREVVTQPTKKKQTGVFGLLEFPRQVPMLQECVAMLRRREVSPPDQLALEAYFASSSHRQRL